MISQQAFERMHYNDKMFDFYICINFITADIYVIIITIIIIINLIKLLSKVITSSSLILWKVSIRTVIDTLYDCYNLCFNEVIYVLHEILKE